MSWSTQQCCRLHLQLYVACVSDPLQSLKQKGISKSHAVYQQTNQYQPANGKELVHFCIAEVIQSVNSASLVIAVSANSEDNVVDRVIVCEACACNATTSTCCLLLTLMAFAIGLLWLHSVG